MRFGNIVKIDRRVVEESNAQTHSDRVRAAVDQNPGISANELAGIVYPNTERATAVTRVSGLLGHLVAKKKEPIKRRKQDGKWRYYSANYRMPYERVKEESKPEVVEKSYAEIENAVSEYQASTVQLEIIALAKDFVWDTGSHDIREFVKWIEAKHE